MNQFLVLLLLISLAACAPRPRATHPKPPPGSREPPVVAVPKEETAERVASNALIEEGVRSLDRGLYDRSADLFQESVTVDPSNGVGYYYLALVKTRTGEYGEVGGLLEKAESLLDPSWRERLDELKEEFNQNRPD